MDNEKIAKELLVLAKEVISAPKKNWRQALEDALFMMENMDLEPRSALKQSGSDNGIRDGSEMEKFVLWAEKQLRR